MRGYRILHLVLAWFLAAGLAVTPVATSVAAQTTTEMSSMMADMPCCPDGPEKQLPQPDACKDCAAMIVCAPQPLQAVLPIAEQAPTTSLAFAELTQGALPYLDDVGSSPPAPPPRS